MKNIFKKNKKTAIKNDFLNISSIEDAKRLVKEDREIYHRDTFSSLYFPCNKNFKY